MRVALLSLGCKVNSYESDGICELFKKKGAEIVSFDEPFDACVINTCSVTNQASAKSRKMIRHAKKLNPNSIVAVIGCYSQMSFKDVDELPEADIVLGNVNKSSVVDLIYDRLAGINHENEFYNVLQYHEFEKFEPVNFNRTRAFLKIEDGCNNFCSYCIIPYTRGPVRSKNWEETLKEINEIVNNGYQEIVLAGIHTGKYNDNGVTFTDLVRKILTETKVKRLRVSSIELNEITDEFLEMLKNNEVIAKHLHLPLQAGSDHVLKMMNRRYLQADYLKRINEIRSYCPDISITTDIIVGFPEETAQDFEETIKVCKIVKFAKIHCFPFSLRAGTKAEAYKEVTDITKKIRMDKLLALDSELQEEYQKKFIGTEQIIICEDKHGEYLLGHSSNYLPIYIPFDEKLEGKMVQVKIIDYQNEHLYGSFIKQID